jgi:hypothetical protein
VARELRQIVGNWVKLFVVANRIDLPVREITPAKKARGRAFSSGA